MGERIAGLDGKYYVRERASPERAASPTSLPTSHVPEARHAGRGSPERQRSPGHSPGRGGGQRRSPEDRRPRSASGRSAASPRGRLS